MPCAVKTPHQRRQTRSRGNRTFGIYRRLSARLSRATVGAAPADDYARRRSRRSRKRPCPQGAYGRRRAARSSAEAAFDCSQRVAEEIATSDGGQCRETLAETEAARAATQGWESDARGAAVPRQKARTKRCKRVGAVARLVERVAGQWAGVDLLTLPADSRRFGAGAGG